MPFLILILILSPVSPVSRSRLQSFQPECLYGSALLLAVVRDTRLSALAGWLPIAGACRGVGVARACRWRTARLLLLLLMLMMTSVLPVYAMSSLRRSLLTC
jgi:hypothetical protein